MERELKFRAFWKERKLMLPVAMLTPSIHPDIDEIVTVADFATRETYILQPSECVVMQFTGLSDKNSKPIYEGDVLKHDILGTSTVIWEHGMFRAVGNGHDALLSNFHLQRTRVVGNVHQNPDLIEK